MTAYNEYSPVYMPITYLVSYGTAFMLAIGILVHTVLFNGHDIWNRLLRQHVKGDVDIHMKLMRSYPDVPDWAYLAFLLVAFALSAVTVAVSSPRRSLSLSTKDCSLKRSSWHAVLADRNAGVGALGLCRDGSHLHHSGRIRLRPNVV